MAWVFLLGCSPAPAPSLQGSSLTAPAEGPSIHTPPLHIDFLDVDQKPVTTEMLKGRRTLLVLVTTYDLASQAQLRVATRLFHEARPRINVVAVVLEKPENRPLVEAFAHALDLGFPVVHAGADWVSGAGPLKLNAVPSVVLLGRDVRERQRYVGFTDTKVLEEALAADEDPPTR